MMPRRLRRCTVGLAAVVLVTGCRSPLEGPPRPTLAEYRPPLRALEPDASDLPATPELPELDETAGLEDYLRYAALNNPGLESAFHRWKAAVERVPQVGALPDPRFTYGYYVSEVETRVGPMEHMLALSQTFPWFGTLRDREDAAARHAAAEQRRLEAVRLDLFYRVEAAYNELYYLKRSIDIAAENIELLLQLERVARARYRVDAASHPDVIRVQVELGKLEDRLRQLRDLRVPRNAALNAALNRSSGAPLPWPTAIGDRVSDVGLGDLLARLHSDNPSLKALDEETARERINSDIARKNGLPDFTLGVAYTLVGDRPSVPDGGDDALLATLTVSVPLWRDKYDAGVREALSRRLAIASARVEEMNRLTAELQQTLFDHKDARRRVELYRDTLIPKSRESLQASLAGFEAGAADFLDVLDTERTLLEFQLGLERALVDRATSLARLDQLVATRLADPTDAKETGP